MSDLVIDELLESLGYSTVESRALGRRALVEAKLTNPRKERIASSKRESVKLELEKRFAVVCSRKHCEAIAASSERQIVRCARPTDCCVCRGSVNQASLDHAIDELHKRELSRLVVLGGSPSTREEVGKLVSGRLELRLISGTDQRNTMDAKADLAWADLIVVWGGTELDHKVSKLYTDRKSPNVVVCPKRGIEALASTIVEAARRR